MLVNQPYSGKAGQDSRMQNASAQKTGSVREGEMKMTGESVMPYSRSRPNVSSVPNMSAMPNMTTAQMPMSNVPPMSNVSPASGMPQTSKNSMYMSETAGTGVGSQLHGMSTVQAPLVNETPTTVESPYYTAGFLRNFLGKNMRVEFLIGTSGALVDRVGVLVEVGASYIVLRPYLSDDLLMCDLYSIKFVTIYG